MALLLALAGCTVAPPPPEPEPPVPVEVEIEAPEPAPQPASNRSPPAKPACEWARIKGVAEVVALDDAEAEFRFYPGDIRVEVPEGRHFESGEEFKAVLLRARGCDDKLEVVDPVP